MTIRPVSPPKRLYRIGQGPNPLACPSDNAIELGSLDDPFGGQPILVAAAERRGAFLEALGALGLAPPSQDVRPIPDRFMESLLVRFGLDADQAWLDLRAPETLAALNNELDSEREREHRTVQHGPITRLISAWAIDHGFQGIAYRSPHNPALTNWGIFEGAELVVKDPARPINPDDPDLHAVARLWNLRIPGRNVR